jgi:hypothetical protein
MYTQVYNICMYVYAKYIIVCVIYHHIIACVICKYIMINFIIIFPNRTWCFYRNSKSDEIVILLSLF